MAIHLPRFFIALCTVLVALVSVATFAGTDKSAIAPVAPTSILSVVLTDPQPDSEALVQQYVEGAFPLAKAQGMREVKAFSVKRILNGDETPEFIGLYAWPSAEAARAVRDSQDYLVSYKPLREKAWKEMMAVDLQLSKGWQAAFDPSRTYTLALVWLGSEQGYNDYVTATASVRDQLGARTVLAAPAVRIDYLAQDKNLTAPDRVVLLEWPAPSAPDRYRETISQAPFNEKVGPAFERVEWFEIQPF